MVKPHDAAAKLKPLLAATASMPNWSPEERAAALWALILDEIEKLNRQGQHPRCRAALRAAFRLEEAYRGDTYDTLAARLKVAKDNGAFGDPAKTGKDAPRKSWVCGVWRLGWAVDGRLCELTAQPDGWLAYGDVTTGPSGIPPEPPADAQPVFVNRLVATYTMKGRAVDYAVTERLVTAREDGVDQYIVRAYSPINGRDSAHVRALLNCRAGPLRSVLDGRGGEIHEVSMRFPKPLRTGELCYFASQVALPQNEQPIVEIQVTSHGIAAGGLTMRVQFDEQPAAAWWFGDCIDARRLDKPLEGDPQRLTWTAFGYLEHTFTNFCKPLAKYGIAWEWT